jgi:hypothetical protein
MAAKPRHPVEPPEPLDFEALARSALDRREIADALDLLGEDADAERGQLLAGAVAAVASIEERARSELDALRDAEQELRTVEDRCIAGLDPELYPDVSTIQSFGEDLERALNSVASYEQDLRACREQLDEVDAGLRENERARMAMIAQAVERSSRVQVERAYGVPGATAARVADATPDRLPRWRRVRALLPSRSSARSGALDRERSVLEDRRRQLLTKCAALQEGIDRNMRAHAQTAKWLATTEHRLRRALHRRAADPDLASSAANARAAHDVATRALTEKGIVPYYRGRLNEAAEARAHRRYSTRLTVRSAGGLAELSSDRYRVATSAGAKLAGALDQMAGGSVGISGPRGAGKTTLIRSFCAGNRPIRGQLPALATVVSVPVRYEPGDFVVHLLTKLCREFVSEEEEERMLLAEEEARTDDPAAQRLRRVPDLTAAAAAVLVLAGLVSIGIGFARLDTDLPDGVIWGAMAAVVGVCALIAQSPPIVRFDPLQRGPIAVASAVLLALVATSVITILVRGAAERVNASIASTLWTLSLVLAGQLLVARSSGGRGRVEEPEADLVSQARQSPLLARAGGVLLLGAGAATAARAWPGDASNAAPLTAGLLGLLVATLTAAGVARFAAGRAFRSADSASEPSTAHVTLVAFVWLDVALLAAGAGFVEGGLFGVELSWWSVCGAVLLVLGTTTLAVTRGLRRWIRRRARIQAVASANPANVRSADDELAQLAARCLRRVRVHERRLAARSLTARLGGTLPFGAEAGRTRSTERSRVDATFPDVVGAFRDFVAKAAANAPVVIGIDELDKIASRDEARQFLNVVKAIFGIDNCWFLISISDDAVASYERRGLPFRDALDSSLDEIVRVEPLDLETSRLLLSERVIGLSLPFVGLSHCLAGGLARELIRSVRGLLSLQRELRQDRLAPLARALVASELTKKRDATITLLTGLDRSAEVTRLVEGLAAVDAAGLPALERHLHTIGSDAASPERLAVGIPGNDDPQARKMVEELLAYWYFCETVAAFFDERFDRTRMQAAEQPEDDPRSLHRLVRARRELALGPHVAWKTVSDFRVTCALGDPLTFPGAVAIA